MAIFNEILTARFPYFLQRAFGMKGDPPTRQLSGEVMPVFPLFTGVEMRYLEQWNLFAVSQGEAAGAGNLSAVRLRNPVGSNVVAIFEACWFNTSAAGDIPFLSRGAVNADLANIIAFTSNRLDARSRNPQSSLILSAGTRVAFGAIYAQFGVAAGTKLAFIDTDIQEIPLLPGDAIEMSSNVAAATVNASFRWRERFLEDSEKI